MCKQDEKAALPLGSERNAGFTLVELMVVVAIIAILAAIGVPRMAAFIKTSETAEAVEQSARIVKGIRGYVDSHPNVLAATIEGAIAPGAGKKGNLGGSVAADEINTLIPHLVLADDATFVYAISIDIQTNGDVYTCVKAWRAADTEAYLYYSNKASAKVDWEGNVFRAKYIDNTVAAVAGGYCAADGTAAADAG